MADVSLNSGFNNTEDFWAARAGPALQKNTTVYAFQNAAGFYVKVLGTGFTYSGDNPGGGEYFGIAVFSDAGFTHQVASYSGGLNWDLASYFSSGSITGLAGEDTITGSGGNDTIIGGYGADSVNGGEGSDTYVFRQTDQQHNDLVVGDVINDTGSATDIDTIRLEATSGIFDFTEASITGFEALEFTGIVSANFNAAQLPFNLRVKGIGASEYIFVINATTGFSAAGWQFTNYLSFVIFSGSAASADNFTGSVKDDYFFVGAGDTFDGIGGTDAAIFNGANSGFSFERNSSLPNGWLVTDIFSGDGNEGIVSLKNVEQLWFTAGNTIVEVSDLIGVLSDQDDDANSVAETTGNGNVVGVIALAADGSGQDVTFSLGDNAGGRFQINATTGVVTVLDAALIDYEAASSHTIKIVATSADGSFTVQQFAIGIGFVPLNGTPGPDVLTGTEKIDTITGGLGRDVMSGAAAGDIFNFDFKAESKKGAAHDVITDFSGHQSGGDGDRIDLHDIDANSKKAHNQDFKFIGSQHFHHKAGELHFVKINKPGTTHDRTMVEGDTNGDGKADFQIELSHLIKLNGADFIL